MKHLIECLKKYKFQSVLAPLLKCLEACFDLAVPLIVANIIDKGIGEGNKNYIVNRFFLLLAMAALGLASCIVAQFFAAKVAVDTSADLRHNLLSKIQSLSLNELDSVTSSTLITRMTSDINQVQNGLNMFLRLFMRSPFIVFGAMILAFIINAKLALIFVGAIALLFVIVFSIIKITAPLYKGVQQNLDGVTEITNEDLDGVRVIRAFSREEKQKEKFKKQNSVLLSSQIKVGKIAAIMNPLTYVVVNGVIILVLWLGAKKINSGLLLAGDIIALINYISQILIELVKLANLITQLGRSVAGMNRIGQILDMESSMCFPSGDGAENLESEEAIRFENVSFKYQGGGENSLSNISFSVKTGETVGIIGATGSGKTTLINLILRFYDTTEGKILFRGKSLEEYSQKKLRDMITVVPQKAQLFKGTVRSNLLLGNENATDEELWKALEMAQAASFIREKTGGLDEPVEQGGANFSGGQKQRLTIARALASLNAERPLGLKERILILDDSFSALDFATDAALRKALRSLPKDVTVFMISQRAGSLSAADLILVLDDGELVGKGRHEQLLSSCEVYKEIYESQCSGGEAK